MSEAPAAVQLGSEVSQAVLPQVALPGSWRASDGQWYPPESHPAFSRPPVPLPEPPVTQTQPAQVAEPGGRRASDGQWIPLDTGPSFSQPTEVPKPEDLAMRLQRIVDLHRQGALSDDEFREAKSQVLTDPTMWNHHQ
jgi:hypothetical protein